jgi:S1-C subfamily serine protease
MYTVKGGDEVTLTIVRGQEELVLNVPVIERREDVDRLADLIDPEKSRVQQLGVVCVDIDDRIQEMLPALRIPSGVVVAARIQDPRAADVLLLVGDVIHSVNGAAVSTVEGLQSALEHLQTHSSVVLQVERAGKLSFFGSQLD